MRLPTDSIESKKSPTLPLPDFPFLRIVFTGKQPPLSILLCCHSGQSAAQTQNPGVFLQILCSSWIVFCGSRIRSRITKGTPFQLARKYPYWSV